MDSKEYGKMWRAKNKQKIKDYQKIYFQNNKPVLEEDKQKRRDSCNKWRDRNPLSMREFAKQHTKDNKEKRYKYTKEWQKKNPSKVDKGKQAIMNKVQWAVESGKIKKSIYCNCCNQKKYLQGHHPDYSKPLEVIWLCRSCHKFLHWHLKTFKAEIRRKVEGEI